MLGLALLATILTVIVLTFVVRVEDKTHHDNAAGTADASE
jgi:hypothetical protein